VIDDLLVEVDGAPRPITVGMSGATVERHGRWVLKAARPTWDRGLDAEADRLRWLAGTAMGSHVAEVVAYEPAPAAGNGIDRLLTTALPGADLTTDEVARRLAPAEQARRFGRHLRELHDSLDPDDCPFDARLDGRLAAAERRVAEGGVDDEEFEPENGGRTPSDVLAELVRRRPAGEDLVVTHGDWCFPNVLVDPDGDESAWWMCDLGGLGVACRWYDLGIGCRTTVHNVGEGHVAAFLAGYGLAPGEIDRERLDYYVLVDELQ
jgi:aminoglycoside phosphotransferase